MKSYQINEELLNRVILMLVDYQEDAEELENMGDIPNCWSGDVVLLRSELEDLKDEYVISDFEDHRRNDE